MSYVTDLNHFIDPEGELPTAASELLAYLTAIVSAVSQAIEAPITCTDVSCRLPQCSGDIEAWYNDNGTIEWACDVCDENGIISNWRGSEGDHHSKQLH